MRGHWLWAVVAYLIGSFFGVQKILAMFSAKR
jgi:hypothetical protein